MTTEPHKTTECEHQKYSLGSGLHPVALPAVEGETISLEAIPCLHVAQSGTKSVLLWTRRLVMTPPAVLAVNTPVCLVRLHPRGFRPPHHMQVFTRLPHRRQTSNENMTTSLVCVGRKLLRSKNKKWDEEI